MKTRRRSGFTLVEVLVSMALILFIMSILAGAFGAASQAVSDLKAAGDLAEKLRSATNVIKHDLGQDHFTDSNQGSAHLSDPTFWSRLDPGKNPTGPVGFFRIYETAKDIQETAITTGLPALDLDNIPSFVQTTAALHFTIAQHGTRRSDFLSAVVAAGSPLLQPSPVGPYPNLDNFYEDTAGVFSSQYAEVEFFLGPRVDSTDASTGTGASTAFRPVSAATAGRYPRLGGQHGRRRRRRHGAEHGEQLGQHHAGSQYAGQPLQLHRRRRDADRRDVPTDGGAKRRRRSFAGGRAVV